MKPKIVFVVMSAVAKPATIDQLARALAPHQVLVHHDFSQTPDFQLTAPNVQFVPNPKRTGWAVFGFVEGIFHSLEYAVQNLDFDYLQLLSPSCLPIKSMAEYEAHVEAGPDAHFDCVDLLADRDALMSVGYRVLTAEHTMTHRILRRLSQSYFSGASTRRDLAGVWLRSGGGKTVSSLLSLLAVKALSLRLIGRHIFDSNFRPYYGSAWFGARRHVVAGMVAGFHRPGVRGYFSRVCIAEEFLIPTLLMQLVGRKGAMNHLIQSFEHAHPGKFNEADMEQLSQSPAFFARKFVDDPQAAIRLKVLSELVSVAPDASRMDAIGQRGYEATLGLQPVPTTPTADGKLPAGPLAAVAQLMEDSLGTGTFEPRSAA